MELVTQAARGLVGADGATFVLRDGDLCHYADEEAIAPLWKGQRFPMSMCISGWVMLQRRRAVIEDIYKDARIPADAYRPTFVRSLAMVPIRTDLPLGAIGAYWASPTKPTDRDLDNLQAFADSVSVALENLRLLGTLETKVKEMERLNDAKDRFLSTVSHELRSPLNVIIGWTDMLMDPDGIADSDYRIAIETIHRNSKLQAKMVEELLDTTRIVTGSLKLEQRPVELADRLQAAVTAARDAARFKEQEIVVNLPKTVGSFMGDGERIEQVFGHLLSNAVKFTPRERKIIVTLEREGPNARVDIVDDGVGLTEALIPSVFDRFFQADSSSTRKHGGLGLGLAIARHIVEAHGGRIAATSAGVGHGSTFTVWLPLATAAAP